jgi:hypothetical protein
MDILGFDNRQMKSRWSNAASDDLAVIDSEISIVTKEIAVQNAVSLEASKMIAKCSDEKAGLFNTYNCKANTGKTLNEWERILSSAETQVKSLNQRLKELKLSRTDAVQRIKDEAIASGKSAEAAEKIAQSASAQSAASGAKALAIGKWAAIGIGSIAAIALIYFKIIKKK